MNNMRMRYFDRIDGFERVDVNKISKSNECEICLYCFFLNKGFNFQPYVCSRCHDLLMMSVKLKATILLYWKLKTLVIVVLLLELANVKLYNYYKIVIWLKKVDL